MDYKKWKNYDCSMKQIIDVIFAYSEVINDAVRTEVSVESLFSTLKIIKSDLMASMKQFFI